MKKYTNKKTIIQVVLCLTPFRLQLHHVKQIIKTLFKFSLQNCPICSNGIQYQEKLEEKLRGVLKEFGLKKFHILNTSTGNEVTKNKTRKTV